MEENRSPSSRRTRSGITYSNLGQFRVLRVGESPSEALALDSPEAVAAFWRGQIATLPWFDPDKEHMVVLVLNTRNRLKGWNLAAIGTLNESVCHPREILRPVLVAAGYAFVIAHNHPSGNPSPSYTDRRVTERLKEAASVLMVRLLDHVVMGRERFFSFREAGLL